MIEEYRDIKDLPGFQISNMGNVRSLDRISPKGLHVKGRMLAQLTDGNQLSIRVTDDSGKKIRRNIAKLVLQTFDTYYNDTFHIATYKDGNQYNCCVDNLRWSTQEIECRSLGYKGKGIPKNMKYYYLVIYNDLNEIITYGIGTKDITNQFAICGLPTSTTVISRSLKEKRKLFDCFIVKEVNENEFNFIKNNNVKKDIVQAMDEYTNRKNKERIESAINKKKQIKKPKSNNKNSSTKSKINTNIQKYSIEEKLFEQFEEEVRMEEQAKKDKFKAELLKRLNH